MLEPVNRWKAALESSGVGVWDWDIATNDFYYSRIWKAMRGIAEDDPGPSMLEWKQWVHPDDCPAVERAIHDHVAGLTPNFHVEHRIAHRDGGYRWIVARGQICKRAPDGKPLQVIGTNVDIDAVKRASLRAERHGRLYDAIATCNLAIARREPIADLTRAICDILVTSGEMNLAWVGGADGNDGAITPFAGSVFARGEESAPDAARPIGLGASTFAFRHDEAIWVQDRLSDPRAAAWGDDETLGALRGVAAIPIRQRGRPSAVLTLGTDEPRYFDETTRTLLMSMTTQLGLALDTLDAERAATSLHGSLHRSVQRSRAMFDRAPLGIALKDSTTGRYLEVNPKFLEIVGYTREALLGMRWQDITHDDDRAREADAIVPFLAGETPTLQIEKRYIRSDGRAITVNMTLAQFEISRQGNRRYLAMIEDVTERRDLQQRLSQRQRLEALGQLTGGIAHDFNNLLTVIVGNSEALALDLGEGDLGELAQLILTSGERAADLTRRLLTFARKQSLTPRSIAIGALIEGLLPLLRRAVPDRIEFVLSARFSPATVYADPSQLEMALLNLVLNARDACRDSGRIEIAVTDLEVRSASRRHGELQPAAYRVISVSDNGEGMSPETLEQAFDPFFTTKGPGQGSGLGLSMVYGFARQSGGHVDMASRAGKGTTVRLYLPAARTAPVPTIAAPATSDDCGNGETVLIAEDDPIVRRYVGAQIGALGYRTVVAADGKAALAALRDEASVDLLFTDIAMSGGMDGIELAMQARDARPDLPVLFTSGHAEQHLDRLAEIEAGLLRKPYRRKDLAAHLRRALSDRAKP